MKTILIKKWNGILKHVLKKTYKATSLQDIADYNHAGRQGVHAYVCSPPSNFTHGWCNFKFSHILTCHTSTPFSTFPNISSQRQTNSKNYIITRCVFDWRFPIPVFSYPSETCAEQEAVSKIEADHLKLCCISNWRKPIS